jgi:CheY-like chemotaxis protein
VTFEAADRPNIGTRLSSLVQALGQTADISMALTSIYRSVHDYIVLVARSAAEALRLTTEHVSPIHLLPTDVIMPDMSGPTAAAHLAPESAPGP